MSSSRSEWNPARQERMSGFAEKQMLGRQEVAGDKRFCTKPLKEDEKSFKVKTIFIGFVVHRYVIDSLYSM